MYYTYVHIMFTITNLALEQGFFLRIFSQVTTPGKITSDIQNLALIFVGNLGSSALSGEIFGHNGSKS